MSNHLKMIRAEIKQYGRRLTQKERMENAKLAKIERLSEEVLKSMSEHLPPSIWHPIGGPGYRVVLSNGMEASVTLRPYLTNLGFELYWSMSDDMGVGARLFIPASGERFSITEHRFSSTLRVAKRASAY
jgi:hypothetical protein